MAGASRVERLPDPGVAGSLPERSAPRRRQPDPPGPRNSRPCLPSGRSPRPAVADRRRGISAVLPRTAHLTVTGGAENAAAGTPRQRRHDRSSARPSTPGPAPGRRYRATTGEPRPDNRDRMVVAGRLEDRHQRFRERNPPGTPGAVAGPGRSGGTDPDAPGSVAVQPPGWRAILRPPVSKGGSSALRAGRFSARQVGRFNRPTLSRDRRAQRGRIGRPWPVSRCSGSDRSSSVRSA